MDRTVVAVAVDVADVAISRSQENNSLDSCSFAKLTKETWV